MPSGNSFSWLSFLLGLAIGLWIAIVVLFLTDQDDHQHCCDVQTPPYYPYPDDRTAWVPGGDSDYYCTNDDEGGAIVVDEGGAIVVDEGGAIVVDAGGHVPAPDSDSDQLDRERLFEEFRCSSNDEGGAIVVDRTGRRVVVSMPNNYPSARCARRNGNAVVVNDTGSSIQIDEGGAIVVDEGGAIVVDESADSADDQQIPSGAPESNPKLAYCMVASPTSEPIVIRPTP